jgi:2-hydroxychromene-2-carboxylate isomerase
MASPRSIDYVFTLLSPWAYLGFDRFHAIARAHGVDIRYRPVVLGEVFAETGGLPLAKRAPARQAYRFMELQRWRAARGVDLILRPKSFPFNGALADRIVLALVAAGQSPEAYLRAAHRAVWAEDRNLADESELVRLLTSVGQPEDMLARAREESVGRTYAENRDWALGAGVFGAPSYILDGEIFWGQDRLDLLEQALVSGRSPYRPDSDF